MSFPRQAIVLAAGLGTRLRPATDTTPKPLLAIGARPMIEYPIRMLAAAGVEDIVVNLHHLGDRIRTALGDGAAFGVRIRYSPEDPILDTGGAIARARRLLRDEPFAVANCDTLADPDLAGMAELHEARGALATLLVRADPDAERYGALDLDSSGRVRRFLGEPTTPLAEPLARRMFCGVHVLSPEIFSRMPSDGVFSITRDVYKPLIARGARDELILGFDHAGYWRDLGTPQSLDDARGDVAAGRFAPCDRKSY